MIIYVIGRHRPLLEGTSDALRLLGHNAISWLGIKDWPVSKKGKGGGYILEGSYSTGNLLNSKAGLFNTQKNF